MNTETYICHYNDGFCWPIFELNITKCIVCFTQDFNWIFFFNTLDKFTRALIECLLGSMCCYWIDCIPHNKLFKNTRK